MSAPIPDFVAPELSQLGLTVCNETVRQLADYLDALLTANQRINLTGIREPEQAWRRHIIDSLTLLPGLEPLADGAAVIDVGSGGGLPGMPLAIARPDLRFSLLEATGKKAGFLRQTAESLGLAHVRVQHNRAETLGQDAAHRQQYDAAVCRAVGPMAELLEYTLPLIRVEGFLLAMKGPTLEAELAAASDALAELGAGDIAVFEAYPQSFNIHTLIVHIQKARPTPRTYPRPPGTPRHDPISG